MPKRYHVPVLRTTESTSNVVASLVAYLNVELAPRITRHGVLVEVYGEGILLVGDSGVGKSETAIELIKRGHRIIADDAVEIRETNHGTLEANAPELIRHYIELRGIGVIDVCRLFGMSAVKDEAEIDMVINIGWLKDKKYDLIEKEIRTLKAACGEKILKVIIETCFLTDEEKIKMCEIVTAAGADYIKTSTGFGAQALPSQTLSCSPNTSDQM